MLREIDATSPLDAAMFQHSVAEACAPVVLRGLCRSWPARHAAARSAEELCAYLLRFDTGAPAQAFIGAPALAGRYFYGEGPDGFNFARETLRLSEALPRMLAAARDPALNTVYMGSVPVDSQMPGFAEDNGLSFLPVTARPRVWLGNASRVACHYDAYDNIACVVAGQRRFTLYPPDAIGDLYVGRIDHTLAGQPVSLATEAPDGDPRYPRFAAAQARALVAELAPGDALYLPKLWWHAVDATEPFNMLVNYWWDGFSFGPDAPHTAMLLAMIAIAERPPAERAAWRAYFDHYVFRPNGHPLAHLPEAEHGLLGPLRAGNYGRIRAKIMQWLRGG